MFADLGIVYSSIDPSERDVIKYGIELVQEYVTLAHYKEALQLLEFIYAMDKIKKESEGELFMKENIASLSYKNNEFSKSRKIFTEVKEKRERILGELHPKVLSLSGKIFLIKCKEGDAETALFHLKDLLKKQRDLLGNECEDVQITKSYIVVALLVLEKYDKAVALCKELLSESKLDALEVCQLKNNLAIGLVELGNFEEAENVFYELHESLRDIYGIGHPDTVKPISRIALIYHLSNKLEDGKKFYMNVLSFQKSVFGPCHSDTLWTRINYGWLLFDMRKHSLHIKVHGDVLKDLKPQEPPEKKLIAIAVWISKAISKHSPLDYMVKPVLSLWKREEFVGPKIDKIWIFIKNKNIDQLMAFVGNNFK